MHSAAHPVQPREGSTLYYALRAVPATTRDRILAALQLCQVLCAALHEVTDPAVAEKKIHWWHEEITRLQQGSPRHPASQCVAELLPRELIRRADWLAVLTANNDEKFINAADEAAYQARIQQDYSVRLQLCTELLQQRQHTAASHWAEGLGQFDRLRQFHRLYHLGYPVFPDTDYTEHGILPADIGRQDAAEPVRRLFEHRIDSAMRALDKAVTEPDPALGPQALAVYITARLRLAQLRLWRQRSILPSQAYCSLTPFKKAWLAWRCRPAFRGYLQ